MSRSTGGKRGLRKIREESPCLLIGSPPCTYFSMLQELNVAVHGHKPEWIEKFRRKSGRLLFMFNSAVNFTSISLAKAGISCTSTPGRPDHGLCRVYVSC